MTKNKRNKARKSNPKTQCSVIKGLTPYIVQDKNTGEAVPRSQWEQDITLLINEVLRITQKTWTKNKNKILDTYEKHNDELPSSPTGIVHTYKTAFNMAATTKRKTVLAKSRIKELAEHKIASETLAWWRNDNPNKGELTFNKKINLGAVNKQMCSVDYDDKTQEIILTWKCWQHEYEFYFTIPGYVLKYDINKFTKPTIQITDDNKIIFYWTVKENLKYRRDTKTPNKKRIIGGYDLGRVLPFHLTIMTDTGKVIAKRKASSRLIALNDKRERVLANKKSVIAKIDAYTSLGIYPDKVSVLEVERDRLGAAAKRLGVEVAHLLGAEVACLCMFHGVDVVAGEDLSWVSEEKGCSRWVHGECEDSVAHACRRVGSAHTVVNPAYSSSTCPSCGKRGMVYDSSSRLMHCPDCGGDGVDRDEVGSFNVALRAARGVFRSRLKELNAARSACSCGFPVSSAGVTGVVVVPGESQAQTPGLPDPANNEILPLVIGSS